MRKFTRPLALSAVALAFGATAQAGSPGAYSLGTVTTAPATTTYVQPSSTTYVQPYTAQPSQPQVGEIIYNTEPLQPTTSYTTDTMSGQSSSTTYSDSSSYNIQTEDVQMEDGQPENGSYVSSPIAGTNTSSD